MPPVPCVPVEMAPAAVCSSMSPILCRARPRPFSRSLSSDRGVPASTVTVIASRSRELIPTNRSGRIISPSLTAMSVNEWPLPTIFTGNPSRLAAITASATPAASSGAITCDGLAVASPDQLLHERRVVLPVMSEGYGSALPSERPTTNDVANAASAPSNPAVAATQ